MAPDKKITRLADNLHFPNGVTLSPDDKTLYIGDFNAQEVIAVPIISPGMIDVGFAHVAAHLSGGWGTDGLATDANGDVYVAHYMGEEIVVLDRTASSSAPSPCRKAPERRPRTSPSTMAICTSPRPARTRSGGSR